MKKVININFQGTVVPIEESAYEMLRQYIDSLRQHFNDEEGRDEIINDIEGRISELFQIRLKDGATCITEEDVSRIMDNIGRPKDFDDAGAGSSTLGKEDEENSRTYSARNQTYGGKRLYRDQHQRILGGVCSGIGVFLGINPWIVRILFILSGLGIIAYIILWVFLPADDSLSTESYRKFYRNPDDRVIGGVCGGIGSYFNINPWIPRVIFLLPFISFIFRWQHFAFWTFPDLIRLTFSPGTFLVYVILWIVIPEAKTTSEKLQMKGEKVDMNSIRESVTKEMKEVGERMEKLGKQAGDYMKGKSPDMRNELSKTASGAGGILGRIIVTLVKIFAYIILGAIAFAILAAMFGIGIAAVWVFPLKDYLVTDGWQNILAWLTLVFFIGIPVVGTIVYILRQLSGRKNNNHFVRNVSIGLWIFGWICLFSLISFVGREFKYASTVTEDQIELSNPTIDYLEVKPIQVREYRWKNLFSFEPYTTFGVTNDTALLPNVRLRIIQSADAEYAVKYFKISNGYSGQAADDNASRIHFDGYQQDSILYLSNSIGINKNDKFRNQHVDVAIAVPVNHRIKIDRGFFNRGQSSFYFYGMGENPYFNGNLSYRAFYFTRGQEYIMKEDGLHKIGSDNTKDPDEEERYRFKSPEKFDSLKEAQESEIKKMERSIDSTKNAHKKQMQRLEDSLKKERDRIDQKLESLQARELNTDIYPHGMPMFTAFLSYI